MARHHLGRAADPDGDEGGEGAGRAAEEKRGDGVELTVEPKRAGLSPEQVRALAQGVSELYAKIQSEEE